MGISGKIPVSMGDHPLSRRISVRAACLSRALIAAVLLLQPYVAKAEPPESTLAQIRRFNPRLSADDRLQLPLKLHSLLKDEYAFFRGTADLFYDWCREHCADWMKAGGDHVMLHGDVHLGNIGAYRAASGMRFAVVDLDETFIGPYQLDLLRGLISLRLAASDNRIVLKPADRAALLDQYLASYSDGVTGKVSSEGLSERHPLVKLLLKEAVGGNPAEYAEKFCEGTPPVRFRSVRMRNGRVTDIMTPVDDRTRKAFTKAAHSFLAGQSAGFAGAKPRESFGEKDILDVVQWSRIDSGGSQGLRKYLVLIAADPAWENAPLLLQFKEEPAPAAARAGLVNSSSTFERAAQVATAYTRLVERPPRLIGHADVDGRGYLIRTKDPYSEEPEPDDFKSKAALKDGAALLGETLGHAHRAALRVHPDGDKRAAARAAELKMLEPQLAARCEASLSHFAERFVNLRQDPAARALVDAAKRRIHDAEKACD